MAKKQTLLTVESIKHDDATRKNIPTAEFQSVMRKDELNPVRIAYERRNRDLDPQLVWRGKDEQDWSDLVVHAPPLYIQEKVHPKVLIDDLLKQTREKEKKGQSEQLDLFADFNGLPDEGAKTEFYQHDANWTNRMILGDSLQVMASLAEREGLRGKVQCIYFDPPYGIKFNSNFQWSTTSRDVKDGNTDHITREPEQVKAFRDTWRDGIHSYLTYLRDRLTVARDLLTDSGSIFVQIGDENVHRVRAVMDEVFGDENAVALIAFKKTSGAGSIAGGTDVIPQIFDYVIWYSKSLPLAKYRQLFRDKVFGEAGASQYQWIEQALFIRRRMSKAEKEGKLQEGERIFGSDNLTSASGVDKTRYPVTFEGQTHTPHPAVWKTSEVGMKRLIKTRRIIRPASSLSYVRYIDDFPAIPLTNFWDDTASSFMADKVYVVQTNLKIVERCVLMSTDPGDLVLDPTWCNLMGKPVITATQMLESMTKNPRPTRAEATDVANAILDGSDAVMLSGETASGKYPLRAVDIMDKISRKTEKTLKSVKIFDEHNYKPTISDSVSKSVCQTAEDLQATAIITCTSTGHTAKQISRHRPLTPIIAVTSNEKEFRKLVLVWGVRPVLIKYPDNTDELIDKSLDAVKSRGLIKEFDLVVITAGIPFSIAGNINLMKIEMIR